MKEIQTKRTPRFRRWCRKGYAAFASLRRQVTIGVLSVSMSTILLSTTTPVQAQTVDSLTIARELEIEKVEVTGVKATPTRSTMSSTSVFDRKAGASAPVQTLESVLRLSPAIDLRERSGRGTQADIMIRGGSFDQTMVMLNGINFTDARTGHQSHSLPIDIDCIAGIDLIDFKIEFGRYHGDIILADEISPDTCRLWDKETHEKLDKDRFRRDMGGEEDAYKEIMKRLLGE